MELPSFELDYSRWGIQLLFLIPALINLGLFIYTLLLLPNNRTNYSFSIFVLLVGLWQITEGLTRLSVSEDSANAWYRITGILAIFVTPFGVLFALNMMKGRLKISHKLIFVTQFVPAILSSFVLIMGLDHYEIKPSEDWYWVFSQPNPLLSIYLIYVWISLNGLLLLVLLWRNWSRSRYESRMEGMKALLLAIGFTFPFIGGIIAEVIVPLTLDMAAIPLTTPLFTCFSVASLIAILQYNMLEYSPKHQWEQIVETMNEGIIIVDNANRIMYANNTLCKMLGYRDHEIKGMHVQELFPDKNSKKPIKELLMKGPSKYELKLKSGEKTWMIMSGSPYLDAKGRVAGTIGLFNNINNLKKAEKAILLEKERLKLTIEAGKMVTVDFDLASGKVNLSDNSIQVLGINSRINDIDSAVNAHIHADDLNIMKESLKTLKESGQLLDLQFRIIRPDTKEIIWVERRGEIIHGEGGQIVGMRGVLMDITQRMETETRLFQNTERLRAIFENEPECVKVVGINGNLLEMNPAGLAMLEAVNIEELKQHDIIEYVHPKDRKMYMDMHQKVSKGESGNIEFRIIGIRGTLRWMESNAVPLRNSSGEVYAVLSVSRDITEIKKKADEIIHMKEYLEKSEKGLKEAQKMARMGSWEADFKTDETYWSDEVYEIFGVAKSDITPSIKAFLSFIYPNNLEYVKRIIEEGEKSFSDYSFHSPIIRKDGVERYIYADCRFDFDKNNKPCRIHGIIHDITDQKNAELKLKQSEIRLLQAQEIAHVGSWAINFATNVSVWSDEAYRIYGIEPAEQIFSKEDWMSFIHPDDLEMVKREIEKSYTDFKGTSFQHRIIRKDGIIRYVNSKSRFEFDETGKPSGLIGSVHDITESKLNEIKLQKLLELTNNQNKKLQNFAYIVSHNIRTHSANLSGLVDLIGETIDSQDYRMLKSTSDKLGETIHNLNNIITIQNNANATGVRINLKNEIGKTMNVISSIIRQANVTLSMDIPDFLSLEVEPSYLESIVLNLLTNAIKYKHPNRNLNICLSTENIDNYTVLSVRDNGLGINLKKYGSDMFGMYKKFHNNPDAVGLGLFIVKSQIEAMNGRIEVESSPGVGSTFRVYFYRGDSSHAV